MVILHVSQPLKSQNGFSNDITMICRDGKMPKGGIECVEKPPLVGVGVGLRFQLRVQSFQLHFPLDASQTIT